MRIQTPLPVLLVEDNEIDIEITRRVVSRSPLPIDLTVAHDGAEALALLLGERSAPLPRLILLDLRLPLFDGREVLRRIKNHPDLSPVPVAVLTGASGERPLKECLRLGSNMYFVKPISVADVTNLVSTVRRYWEVMEALQRRAGQREERQDVDA
jgi:CheY-like chemotaxis protein